VPDLYPQPANPKMHGRSFAQRVCDALGLDSGSVRDLTIRIPVDDAVKVEVLAYVRRDEGDELLTVLSRYELVELVDVD
jgi:RNA polymerase-interacting CarD/CdnL/TRCF family regulator